MKKSVLMYVITVGLVVFVLTSCGKACGMPDAASAAKTDMYEDGNSAVVLTPEELRLLSDAFGEEERLKEGRLFSYQMEALSYLRDGMDYLEGRYQDRHFQYESFIPANKFQPWAATNVTGLSNRTLRRRVSRCVLIQYLSGRLEALFQQTPP